MNTKRIFAALSASAMALSLCACAGTTDLPTEPAAATPAQTTPEAAPESKPAPVIVSGLSEDLYAGQLAVDGTLITLPCNMSELLALGYAFETEASLTPQEDTTISVSSSTGGDIMVGIYNPTDDPMLSYDNATLEWLVFESPDFTGEVQLPKGITLGSSYDDIIAAYGAPADLFENAESHLQLLTYESPEGAAREVEVQFSIVSDKLLTFNIEVEDK